jgi:quercetin dioxygenase-like cupin family protein
MSSSNERLDTLEAEIHQLREQIRKRVDLYKPEGTALVVVGPEWQDFQDGPGKVRLVPGVSNDHQTVMLFRAPARSYFPLHRHSRAQTLIVLSSEPDPARVTAICEGKEVKLSTGGIAQFKPQEAHGAQADTSCYFLLVWTPGFRRHPTKEDHVIWTVSTDVLEPGGDGHSSFQPSSEAA